MTLYILLHLCAAVVALGNLAKNNREITILDIAIIVMVSVPLCVAATIVWVTNKKKYNHMEGKKMSDKPLDCVGNAGGLGKHDFKLHENKEQQMREAFEMWASNHIAITPHMYGLMFAAWQAALQSPPAVSDSDPNG